MIRNLCALCDPVRHRAHDDELARVEALMVQYQRETGKEPMADYLAFETWMHTRS